MLCRFIYGDTPHESSRKKIQLLLVGGNHFVINPTSSYYTLNDDAFNTYIIPIVNKNRKVESIYNQLILSK